MFSSAQNHLIENADYVYQRLRSQIKDSELSISGYSYLFFILGASGDLAKRKIYPTLWWLYRDNLLPEDIHFIGYARSDLTIEKLFSSAKKYMKVQDNEQNLYENFVKLNSYVSGFYDKPSDFERLNSYANEISQNRNANRLFYLALPPNVYENVSEFISKHCRPESPGWLRLIVEKPFGKDLESSNKLSEHLNEYYSEDEIYRIDHYLGKEMVQSILALRFSNRIFSRVWNRDSIAAVNISFKEDIGTEGRGGYFDQFGIIRDIIQNHLIQILSIVAMEEPHSATGEDIRNEKVKVLRAIPPVKIEDVIIGQYVGDKESPNIERQSGYLDDSGVAKDSMTPTYAQVIIFIKNERWKGVPFILRAGKALNEKKAEIRIQFRDTPGLMFDDEIRQNTAKGQLIRDEFVIRIQPNEAIYLKINTKQPGEMGFNIEETDLDLTYNERFKNIKLPDAYERLILDVFTGAKINFVRSDELQEAWRIVDPVLSLIDEKKLPIIPYKFGSGEPTEAVDAAAKYNYINNDTYIRRDERGASKRF